MNKENAAKLLDDTFDKSYDQTRFLNFINELFNGFDVKQKERSIHNTYRDYIDTDYYKQFGTYIDGSGNAVDVLAIKLKRTTSRDRARTMQRNFVAKHLSENNGHAALVAFYDDNPEDWRFSFVKLDYRLERDETGKVKAVEDMTPAKRYSYLVGVNEPNHTCRKQFLELIKEDKINPSIEELESAFSIEKVTKEFFDKYKELYLKLKEALEIVVENDSRIKDDFVNKEISTVDFAKKLLGQIVFLYFLQKKGWLGVEKAVGTEKFNAWGKGNKKFITDLVHGRIVDHENRNGNPVNFFNDILEPLFYNALAIERDDDYYVIYDYICKIPFLNGGLFEPINNYNWKETDILLDNSIFKEIIDTFDEFNFTVKEDEPLEKEVAVDPEMLGKVFENLLDVKDRKSKGAFYTPREIVHYMCQQSLINYLEVNTKSKDIPREDIEKFIRFGDDSSSVDQNHLIKIEELQQRIISGKEDAAKLEEQLYYNFDELTLPKSIKWNKSNRELIDQLLADIKVVDPAVGSGAFPVGMMNEIVKARSTIALFLYSAKSSDSSTYKLKRETIQNCLYGVDIDSSAVDITKLRFWLSLIVDEDDRNNIEPLPNLDYKIMCGNSLLEEFEGVKLFNEKMLGEPIIDHSFEIEQIDSKIDGLNENLHRIYTGKTDDGDPKQIKKQISKLENEKKKILLAPKEKTQQLNLSDAENFKIKQSVRKLREFVALQNQFFDTQSKKGKDKLRAEMDNLEWELIEETLNEDGNEESIQKLQQYKKAKSKPFFLWKLHFAEVFQRENPGFDVLVANPPYISAVNHSKSDNNNREIYRKIYPELYGAFDLYSVFLLKGIDLINQTGSYSWIIPNKFLISDYSANTLCAMKNNGLYATIDVSKHNVFHDVGVYPIILLGAKLSNEYLNYEIDDITNLEDNNLKLQKELIQYKTFKDFGIKIGSGTTGYQAYEIKPLIFDKENRTKDSIPFVVSGSIDPNIINTTKVRYMKDTYNHPYIKYDSEIIADSKWAFWTNEKIVIAGMTKRIEAVYAKEPLALGVGCYAVYDYAGFNPKALLALLNSSFLTYYLNIKYKDKHLAGGYLALNKSTIEHLPLVEIDKNKDMAITELVDQILTITKDEDYLKNPDKQSKVKTLESQIDQLVYQLYDLTPEEIEIVENFNGGK